MKMICCQAVTKSYKYLDIGVAVHPMAAAGCPQFQSVPHGSPHPQSLLV